VGASAAARTAWLRRGNLSVLRRRFHYCWHARAMGSHWDGLPPHSLSSHAEGLPSRGMGSQPAGRASHPVGRASQPAGRASHPMGRDPSPRDGPPIPWEGIPARGTGLPSHGMGGIPARGRGSHPSQISQLSPWGTLRSSPIPPSSPTSLSPPTIRSAFLLADERCKSHMTGGGHAAQLCAGNVGVASAQRRYGLFFAALPIPGRLCVS
jgi:hypothetical protein